MEARIGTAQRGAQRVKYREAGAQLRPPSLDHINVTSGVASLATRLVGHAVMIAVVMIVIVDVVLVDRHASGGCAADQLAHG